MTWLPYTPPPPPQIVIYFQPTHLLSVFAQHVEVDLILDGSKVVLFPGRTTNKLVLMVAPATHNNPEGKG